MSVKSYRVKSEKKLSKKEQKWNDVLKRTPFNELAGTITRDEYIRLVGYGEVPERLQKLGW